MEEIINEIKSANFNERWLQNIYENIKKLEENERLARMGCNSIWDYGFYAQYSYEMRKILLADIKFENLKFMNNELNLMLEDLVPVIPQEQIMIFEKVLNSLKSILKDRKRFIKEKRNKENKIIFSETTELYEDTLFVLIELKKDIFKSIKNLLYVESITPF
jgi:hypothetical protein